MKYLTAAATTLCLFTSTAFADDARDVTLINVFEVPQGQYEAAVDMWVQSRNFLQKQPGYISTALHKSIGPDAKFQLINIAKWESAEAFQAASKAMRETSGIKPVKGLKFTPGLYQVILTD